MSATLQQVVAFALVAMAAAWLARRAWRRRRRATVCEECPRCAGRSAPGAGLVQIDGR